MINLTKKKILESFMQQAIDKLGTFRGQVGNGPITMYLNHWDSQLRLRP